MTTLEHIGIAVENPKTVEALLGDLLGLRTYKSETVEREGVRTHFIGAGETKLELLEAIDSSSPVQRFLTKRGEGVHHLAFEVKSVAEVIKRATEMGLSPLSESSQAGADGKRVAFFHPRDTHGLLIEVCETAAATSKASPEIGSVLEFGSRQSPAVVIVTTAHGLQHEIWMRVASMLESCFYVVVVGTPTGAESPEQPVARRFTDEEGMALIVSAPYTDWAREFARRRQPAVRSLAECSFHDSEVVLAIELGRRAAERYVIPAARAASRSSIRLLADLIAQTMSPADD
ncbi:MAG: methylmalonyl-CoA epimerase [Rhodothermales bacterium]|nr:methylmalonyl-CoA epimerase [Rhodothermales bacterium]